MERYEEEKRLSICWFNRANDLRGAAGAVWFAMENESNSDQVRSLLGMESHYRFSAACPFVFWMLCGLSLELLYKALIIENKQEPEETHNLQELSRSAKIKMSTDDFELLGFLTEHINWAGKYPVPKEGKNKKGKATYDKHTKRMLDALTSLVPGMSIPARQRNERLDCGDYLRLWTQGRLPYWELYQQSHE